MKNTTTKNTRNNGTMTSSSLQAMTTANVLTGLTNLSGVISKSHNGHVLLNTFGNVYKAKYDLAKYIKSQSKIVTGKKELLEDAIESWKMSKDVKTMNERREHVEKLELEYLTALETMKIQKGIQADIINKASMLFDDNGIYESYCNYIKATKSLETKELYAKKFLNLFGLDVCGGIHLSCMDSFLVQDFANENVSAHKNVIKPISKKAWLIKSQDLMLQNLVDCGLIDTDKYVFSGKEYQKVNDKAKAKIEQARAEKQATATTKANTTKAVKAKTATKKTATKKTATKKTATKKTA